MTERLRRLSESKFIRDTLILQASKLGTTILSVIALSITIRLVGIEQYGVWKLMLAFFAIWQTFEITGMGMVTATGISLAIGRRDADEILNLMAFFVKIALLWAVLSAFVLFLIAPPLAARLYEGDSRIGELAAWFSLTVLADALYSLITISLQSRRMMREFALLQNANQVALFVCTVGAVLISPTPEALLIGRLIYSYTTMLMAFWYYGALISKGDVQFPALSAVFRRAVGISPRLYWRSGIAMALDKNVAGLYTQLPITLVGVVAGEAAAGYLGTALDVINRSALLTGPVTDNMQAVVPQAVGRGDFVGLRRNFARVLVALAAVGIGFYALLAISAPLVVPLILGDESAGAVPVVVALSIMGVVTVMGGIFGPLYRAFAMTGTALAIKLTALGVMAIPGWLLVSQMGALGGAWMMNGLFVLSVALTAAVTLPALRRRAQAM